MLDDQVCPNVDEAVKICTMQALCNFSLTIAMLLLLLTPPRTRALAGGEIKQQTTEFWFVT